MLYIKASWKASQSDIQYILPHSQINWCCLVFICILERVERVIIPRFRLLDWICGPVSTEELCLYDERGRNCSMIGYQQFSCG